MKNKLLSIFLFCCHLHVFPSETLPSTLIDRAMELPLIHNVTDPDIDIEIKTDGVIKTDKMLFAMAMEAYRNPFLVDSRGDTVANRVAEHLRNIISGGKEPACRGDLSAWKEIGQAFALAFVKKNPALWCKFSEEEQAKFDLLMRAFAIVGNYHNNFYNWPKCCIYQTYQIGKTWNPNHNDGYVGIMIAAYYYFGGAENVNAFLMQFDYDRYMADFQKAGFTNIVKCWSQAGKTLFEEGGTDAMGGKLVGVRMPFVMAHPLYNEQEIPYTPVDLYRAIGDWMYCHRVSDRSVSGVAYIMNGGSSPLLGQTGMCREFQITDGFPPNVQERSDAVYSYLGWMLHVPIVAAMMVLEDWQPEIMEDTERRMFVGSEDLIYKLTQGYKAFSKGNSSIQYASNLYSDGYLCIKTLWESVVRPACLAAHNGQADGLAYDKRSSTVYKLKWRLLPDASRYIVTINGTYQLETIQNSLSVHVVDSSLPDTIWVHAEFDNGIRSLDSHTILIVPRKKTNDYEIIDDAENGIEWSNWNENSSVYLSQKNPVQNEVNPSATCIRFSRYAQTDNSAAMLLCGDMFDLSSPENRYLHVKLYRSTQGGVSVCFINGNDTLRRERPVNAADTLKHGQWVDYVFDLAAANAGKYTQLVIYPDRTICLSSRKNYYVDDVCLSKHSQPFTAAFGWDASNLSLVDSPIRSMVYKEGMFTFSPLCASAVNRIEIFDMAGRLLFHVDKYMDSANMLQIPVFLPNGIYVGRVSSGNKSYGQLFTTEI